MKPIEKWRWRIHGINGRTHVTHYSMTEGDALECDPQAERLDWTREVRPVPETEAELQALCASSMLRER